MINNGVPSHLYDCWGGICFRSFRLPLFSHDSLIDFSVCEMWIVNNNITWRWWISSYHGTLYTCSMRTSNSIELYVTHTQHIKPTLHSLKSIVNTRKTSTHQFAALNYAPYIHIPNGGISHLLFVEKSLRLSFSTECCFLLCARKFHIFLFFFCYFARFTYLFPWTFSFFKSFFAFTPARTFVRKLKQCKRTGKNSMEKIWNFKQQKPQWLIWTRKNLLVMAFFFLFVSNQRKFKIKLGLHVHFCYSNAASSQILIEIYQ